MNKSKMPPLAYYSLLGTAIGIALGAVSSDIITGGALGLSIGAVVGACLSEGVPSNSKIVD